MSELTDALDRILIWLEEHEDLEFAKFESLQPGLTFEEIEEKVSNLLPLHLPKEVYELYQWGNGAWEGEEDWAMFFHGRTFLSLESALDMYFGLTATDEEADKSVFPSMWSDRWNPRWFPIFQEIDDQGFLVVVLDEEQTETTPILDILFESFDEEPLIIYPTLTKMMLAEAELYEADYHFRVEKIEKLSYNLRFQYSQYKEILNEEARIICQKYKDIPMRTWRG